MKTFLIACAGILGSALLAAPAQAQYYGSQHGRYYGRPSTHANHSAHHDDLEHRDYHRDLDHRQAHRSPMTHRQHDGLHDQLDHSAYHDRLEHRSAHRNGAYYRPRSYYGNSYWPSYRSNYYRTPGMGFYLSRPGFSLRIGR